MCFMRKKRFKIPSTFLYRDIKMTETNTLAQSRLQKLQEKIKDSRKNVKSDPSSRVHLQLSGDIRKNPKSSSQVSSSKGRQHISGNKQSIILDSLLENTTDVQKRSFPRTQSSNYESIKAKEGMILKKLNYKNSLNETAVVESEEPKVLKNYDVVSQKFSSKNKPQNLNQNKSLKKNTDAKSIAEMASGVKEAAQQRLRNQIRKFHRSGGCTEGNPKTSQQPLGKRKSIEENSVKKKITKTQKIEDTSKIKTYDQHKNESNKGNVDNAFETKLLSILNTSESNSSLSSKIIRKMPKSSNSKNQQLNKEPVRSNSFQREGIKSSSFAEKEAKSHVVLKEGAIRNKEIKQSPVSKTKLQTRLQKIISSVKEKVRDSGKKKSSASEENKLINSSDKIHYIELMDWEPSNDDILRSIRDKVDPSEELMEWQDIYDRKMEPCENNLNVVVDTNVLIRNIKLIKKLSKSTVRDLKITLVIPWQVLKELDDLKTKVNHGNVNASARIAIRFLAEATDNDQFSVVFQTQAMHFEECQTQFVVEIPDDHLIKCCYQFKNKNKKVILLSNDINLKVKSITNSIQAVDNKWMSNILDEKYNSTNYRFHCFEKDPNEYQIENISSAFIYKATQILLHFLVNVVAIKYGEKYGDLWPLWVPYKPYIPEMLQFIASSPCFEVYRADLNGLKNFYNGHKSYNDLKPEDVESLGRKCISLALSMINFIPNDLALQFFKDLSFLKTPEGFNSSDITYIEGSYRLAENYFKKTENYLNEFVLYLNELYLEKGTMLSGNKDVLHHIDVNLELINQFRSAILNFQNIQEEIPLDCQVAKSLHKAICDFLGEKSSDSVFPIFSPEDVVQFVNHNRSFFNPVLNWLANQEFSLKEILLRLT